MTTPGTLDSVTTLLDQEVYTELEAARLLRVAPSTLRYWLRGGTVRDITYMPILRPEPTEDRAVLWAVHRSRLAGGVPEEERADARAAPVHRAAA